MTKIKAYTITAIAATALLFAASNTNAFSKFANQMEQRPTQTATSTDMQALITINTQILEQIKITNELLKQGH